MSVSKTIKLVLSISIASSIIVFFASVTNANKSGISGIQLMTQKLDKDPKENRVSEVKPIKLPDEIWKEIQERDKKSQQKLNEDAARDLAKKSPEERKKIENEKEAKYAPEKRTEEELKQEDERIMQLLDKMRKEGQY